MGTELEPVHNLEDGLLLQADQLQAGAALLSVLSPVAVRGLEAGKVNRTHCRDSQGVPVGSQVVLIHKVPYLPGEKSYCLVHLQQIQGGEMAGKKKVIKSESFSKID